MKAISILIIVFLNLTLLAQSIDADEIISQNTNWSVDTVYLNHNVLIKDGVTLVIDPGTVVVSNGYWEIDVKGQVIAVGNSDNYIKFTVADTSGFLDYSDNKGSWNGINYSHTSENNDSSVFDYCILEYGKAIGDNSEEDKGGALFVSHFNKIRISNSIIKNNISKRSGGGFYMENCSGIVENNEFLYNKSYYFGDGGGISMGQNSSGIIRNNVFKYNEANSGAAIYTSSKLLEEEAVTIVNNQCFNNIGLSGIIYESTVNALIANNIICNNKGIPIFGGHTRSKAVYINNTIANNNSHNLGIETYMLKGKVLNNIIWNNFDGFSGQDTTSIHLAHVSITDSVKYNLMMDSEIKGNGNLNLVNPRFVKPSPGIGLGYEGSIYDWSLQDDSPAVNAGSIEEIYLDYLSGFDLFDQDRIYGNRIDMGAIENQKKIWSNVKSVNENRISIYPNPSTEFVTIANASSDLDKIEIFNIEGRLEVDKKVNPSVSLHTINIKELKNGLYYIKIGTVIKKLLINK